MIIWKTRDVVSMDVLEDMNDMYIKCWLEGCDGVQETDTHWRSKKGAGSFNWRLIFDVMLGTNTKAMKFPYLHLQVWDKDLLKWNDLIAEQTLDIGHDLKKCYFTKEEVQVFDDREKVGQGKGGPKAPPPVRSQPQAEPTEKTGLLSDMDDGADGGVDHDEGGVELTAAKGGQKEGAAEEAPAKGAGAGGVPVPGGAKGLAAKAAMRAAGGGAALDAADAAANGAKSAQGASQEDAREFIKSLKSMSGMSKEDPPDSDWLELARMNYAEGKRETMGEICVSIQILPKKVAKTKPAGRGRAAPNTHPYLPPPLGRFQCSWNPFVLGAELCGPKICAYLTCCLVCTAFVALSIFAQPLLNIVIGILV